MPRLIDADALIPTQVHTVVVLKDGREQLESVLYAEQVDDAPTVEPASPWHRVEDGLPEPHKEVLVSGMEAINNSRVYKVMVNDNGTWRPTDYAPSIRWDYWMPIEPPKEDA